MIKLAPKDSRLAESRSTMAWMCEDRGKYAQALEGAGGAGARIGAGGARIGAGNARLRTSCAAGRVCTVVRVKNEKHSRLECRATLGVGMNYWVLCARALHYTRIDVRCATATRRCSTGQTLRHARERWRVGTTTTGWQRENSGRHSQAHLLILGHSYAALLILRANFKPMIKSFEPISRS